MRRIAACCAALLCAAHVLLAGTVTLKASSADAQPGGAASVTIEMGGGEGIGAMHIELSYDASVLSVEGVEEGPALEGAMLRENHATPGRVILSVATAKSVKGNGQLATVRFKVVGEGGKESPLALVECKAWTDGETEMLLPVQTIEGKLRVVRAVPWLPIGVGAGVLAVVLLVVAIGGKKAPAANACPHCGAPQAAGAQFCDKCGKPRAAAACPKCGTSMQGDSRFCPKCGAPRA